MSYSLLYIAHAQAWGKNDVRRWLAEHNDEPTCKQTFIYFIQAGGAKGPVKIGTAKNVAKRMEMLQTGNHEELALLATDVGCRCVEQFVHGHFLRDRIRGEWFTFTPRLAEFVAALRWGRFDPEVLALGRAA